MAFSFDTLFLSLRANSGNFLVKHSVARVILLSSISLFSTASQPVVIVPAIDFLISMVFLIYGTLQLY